MTVFLPRITVLWYYGQFPFLKFISKTYLICNLFMHGNKWLRNLCSFMIDIMSCLGTTAWIYKKKDIYSTSDDPHHACIDIRYGTMPCVVCLVMFVCIIYPRRIAFTPNLAMSATHIICRYIFKLHLSYHKMQINPVYCKTFSNNQNYYVPIECCMETIM